MKKNLLVLVLILVAAGLAGCISVVSHKTEHPVPTALKHPQVDPVIAEIDMVAKLFSESRKGIAYETIARRPGLSPHARVHLIETVRKDSLPQEDKEKIFLVLLQNPGGSQATKPCGESKAEK